MFTLRLCHASLWLAVVAAHLVPVRPDAVLAQDESSDAAGAQTTNPGHADATLSGAHRFPGSNQSGIARFGPDGIQVRCKSSCWSWGLSLIAVGREGNIQPVSTPTIHTCDGRTEYHRDHLIEWYERDSRGVEQGFTILERPALAAPTCAGATDADFVTSVFANRLCVELKVSSDLTPRMQTGGDGIDFLDPQGATR